MRWLVWFRNDLRVDDNPALAHACGHPPRGAADRQGAATRGTPGAVEGEGVVAAFNPCFEQWREHDWGVNKIDFILRQARALATELAARGIPMKRVDADRFGQLPAALLATARRCGCDGLAFNLEYEVNESRRDGAVIDAFEADGREVVTFHDQTVIPPTALKTTTGGFYRVFTPFRRAWWRRMQEEGWDWRPRPTPAPSVALDLPGDPIPAAPGASDEVAGLWPAGREPVARLARFIAQSIRQYDRQRDQPAAEATSTLSPWLAAGAISPRQCFAAVCDAFDKPPQQLPPGPARWVDELIWREFYRHVLVGYPHISRAQPFQLRTLRLAWRDAPDDLERWKRGRTGYPIVDAAMRQLQATGWLHNRLRMVVAMFLSKHLRIDWRHGERHFNQMLVDADLANNNGGWQWSASTGTDAAPWFRIFNPTAQSRRYDPEGAFIRRWCEQLSAIDPPQIHDPTPAQRRATGYPTPICDHAEARQAALSMFRALSDAGAARDRDG